MSVDPISQCKPITR